MIKYVIGLMDIVKHGGKRRYMGCLHRIMSKRIIRHVRYLIRNFDDIEHIPYRYNNDGEVMGTMNRQEWLEILNQIEYSLSYDISDALNKNNNILPVDNEEVVEYLNKQEQEEKKFKQGLRLMGMYYSDIWG